MDKIKLKGTSKHSPAKSLTVGWIVCRVDEYYNRSWGTLPVCLGGRWRAHSSQIASGSVWWPPPPPVCVGWTGNAGVWVVGDAAVPRERTTADRRSAHRWWWHCGSPALVCTHHCSPERGPPHHPVPHLPHCTEKEKVYVSILESKQIHIDNQTEQYNSTVQAMGKF